MLPCNGDIFVTFSDDLSEPLRVVAESLAALSAEINMAFDKACRSIGIQRDIGAPPECAHLPKWCRDKIVELMNSGIGPKTALEAVLMEFESFSLQRTTREKNRAAWIREPVIRQTSKPKQYISQWKDTGYRPRSTC